MECEIQTEEKANEQNEGIKKRVRTSALMTNIAQVRLARQTPQNS